MSGDTNQGEFKENLESVNMINEETDPDTKAEQDSREPDTSDPTISPARNNQDPPSKDSKQSSSDTPASRFSLPVFDPAGIIEDKTDGRLYDPIRRRALRRLRRDLGLDEDN